MDLSKLRLIASCDRCHAWGRSDAYSIWSTWPCNWLDQFLTLALNTSILSIFYISLDLSTIYFAHFSGCWASFVCSCHSIPECYVMFSGVKLSMGSFVLLARLYSNVHSLSWSIKLEWWAKYFINQSSLFFVLVLLIHYIYIIYIELEKCW